MSERANCLDCGIVVFNPESLCSVCSNVRKTKADWAQRLDPSTMVPLKTSRPHRKGCSCSTCTADRIRREPRYLPVTRIHP